MSDSPTHRPRRAPILIVAAAQPACVAADVAANAVAHARAVEAARARVVVFPEMSLTGYELDATAVDLEAAYLDPLVEACERTGTLALAGAPIEEAGSHYIATLAFDPLDAGRPRVAYRKRWLGAAEATRFDRGDEPAYVEVEGWRVGLGICKDTGAAQHVAGVAALDVDVYAAGLVHEPHELAEQHARAFVLARACRAHVVFASFAGPTGGGFAQTAGGSAIYTPNGRVVAEAGAEPGEMVRAELSGSPLRSCGAP